jgi:hypothetical protein
MLGDRRSGSKLWEVLDREIAESGKDREQIVTDWEFQTCGSFPLPRESPQPSVPPVGCTASPQLGSCVGDFLAANYTRHNPAPADRPRKLAYAFSSNAVSLDSDPEC